VVAVEPDGVEVCESTIFCDVSRAKVTVVVDDGLALGDIVLETSCLGVREQEIVVEEGHG
jgi:hypothetical protein